MSSPATWNAAELEAARKRWTFALDESARRHLESALKKAFDPAKTLFDYRREDFDLGPALPVIAAAFDEVKHGLGVALVKGLPREGLSEKEFEIPKDIDIKPAKEMQGMGGGPGFQMRVMN